MLAWPVVTPAQAARALGVSIRGAAKLVDELVRLGIVVPATRRRSWRSYLAADLGEAAALGLDRSRRRPPETTEKAPPHGDRGRAAGPPPEAAVVVYPERAPDPAAPSPDAAAAGPDAPARRGAPADPAEAIDLSRVFAELDLVTKRVRAALDTPAAARDRPDEKE
jgi:hypothetical protein